MARTESISFQVHPSDEQSQIELMQKFHWSLLNTQEIKTVDSHLERRGDSVYNVTKTEHYVKLAFSRDLDQPNLKEVKALEQEYFSLKFVTPPKLFPGHIALWIIGSFCYGIGIIGWVVYFFAFYKSKKEAADKLRDQINTKRQEIMRKLEQYN